MTAFPSIIWLWVERYLSRSCFSVHLPGSIFAASFRRLSVRSRLVARRVLIVCSTLSARSSSSRAGFEVGCTPILRACPPKVCGAYQYLAEGRGFLLADQWTSRETIWHPVQDTQGSAPGYLGQREQPPYPHEAPQRMNSRPGTRLMLSLTIDRNEVEAGSGLILEFLECMTIE